MDLMVITLMVLMCVHDLHYACALSASVDYYDERRMVEDDGART